MGDGNGTSGVSSLSLIGSYQLGRVFGGIHFHRSSRSTVAGRETITKTLRRDAAILIPLANLCLRWQGAGTCVLSLERWQQRELAVSRLQPWRGATVCPRGIHMPCWPGTTLDEYLSREQSESGRRRAIRTAWGALRELHALAGPSGEGMFAEGFSHADATTRNVMYDGDSGRAVWIDFDMCHEPRRPVLWRQADDARAFLYSVARRISAEAVEAVVGECLGDASSGELSGMLRTVIVAAAERPLSFHMAQHRLSPGPFREVTARLLAGLDATGMPR